MPDGRTRIAILSAAPAAAAAPATAEAERLVAAGWNVLLLRPAAGTTKSAAVNGVHVLDVRIPTAFDGKASPLAKSARKAVLKSRELRGRTLAADRMWTPGDIAAEYGKYLAAYRPDVVVAGDASAEKVAAQLGHPVVALGTEAEAAALAARPPKTVDPAPSLLIGASNNAGMGYAWARSVDGNLGIRARNIQKKAYPYAFGVDIPADLTKWNDPVWQLERLADTLDSVTHVLSESALAVHGWLNGGRLSGDLGDLERAGIQVAVLFHGSDIRDPDRHIALHPFSPFADPVEESDRELTATLRKNTAATAEWLTTFTGPVFVSTPDLLDDVPDAVWLPVVVDMDRWVPGDRPPLEREVPVVAHVPSRPFLKGSDLIEPALRDLEARGLIEYRRLGHMSQDELIEVVRDADIVLDHFVIGNYGVVTCQAMAAGRVTVANIAERVRARVPADIPTVQADPETIGAVIEGLLADRDAARAVAARGPAFVREFHDGRRSAAALAGWLRGEPGA